MRSDTVILLDCSTSMNDKDYPPSRLGAAKKSINTFIDERSKASPIDRLAIISFSGLPQIRQTLIEIGGNTQKLKGKVRNISAGGATNITAGLKMAQLLLLPPPPLIQKIQKIIGFENRAKITRKSRKKILLLSDGDHNFDCSSPENMASKLKSNHSIQIQVIGIGDRNSPDFNEARLKKIASRGKYTFIGDSTKLIQKFKQLALKPSL